MKVLVIGATGLTGAIAVQKLLAAGHDVTAFARAAALAHAWLGDAAGAYQVFNTLARNTRDPGSAAWATTWLARLEKGVPRDELLAAMRGEQPMASGFRSWMNSHR